MWAQGYQRFPVSKPVVAQNIASHAVPAYRAFTYLVSRLTQLHFPQIYPILKDGMCIIKQWIRMFTCGRNTFCLTLAWSFVVDWALIQQVVALIWPSWLTGYKDPIVCLVCLSTGLAIYLSIYVGYPVTFLALYSCTDSFPCMCFFHWDKQSEQKYGPKKHQALYYRYDYLHTYCFYRYDYIHLVFIAVMMYMLFLSLRLHTSRFYSCDDVHLVFIATITYMLFL